MEGKKPRNNFYRSTRIVRAKNVGTKIVGKSAKKRFYIHTNIITKKWGEKRAKQFMQEHTNRASKKCREKIVRKKCQKTFFISTRISCPKNGGKKHAK